MKMKIKTCLAAAASVVAVIGLSSQANAGVYDSGTVNFQYYAYGGAYDGYGSPSSFPVPGAATFADYFTVTASGDKIVYDYLSDTTWSPSTTSLDSDGLYVDNGSVIYSVSGIPAITSVSIDPASVLGTSGFSASDLTFNSGAVAVTWMNQSFAAGDTVILDVNGSVPEPSSWALMIAGVGAIGASVRLSRRKGVASIAA